MCQHKLFSEMLWVHPFLLTAQASDLGGSTEPTSFTSISSRWMPRTQWASQPKVLLLGVCSQVNHHRLGSLNWLSTQHKSWQVSSLQLLTWKLHLSVYQSAFYRAHCAAFPALLPQGFVSHPTAGKATIASERPHTYTKAWPEFRKKKQKEVTWEPKHVKVASEIGLTSISTWL